MIETEGPSTPRNALSEATRAVGNAGVAVDGLVVLVRAGLRRAITIIALCAVLLAASTVAIIMLLTRVHAQTEALAALVARVEALAVVQVETRKTAEETSAKVDDAAKAAEERPTVELVPAASASSGRPSAVVRIKPARPKGPPDGSAVPQAPTIELPVKLPPDAQIQTADAGQEKR